MSEIWSEFRGRSGLHKPEYHAEKASRLCDEVGVCLGQRDAEKKKKKNKRERERKRENIL